MAIVGAGPVGLALALGLARHGVRSVLLERSPGTSERSKAPAVHVRTREVLKQWGAEQPLIDAGVLCEQLTLHDADTDRGAVLSLDFSGLRAEADRPGLLVLEQGRTEALLLDAVRETGMCDVRFSTNVTGLTLGIDSVRVSYEAGSGSDPGGGQLDAAYVVGCDGAGSCVREALGLSFDGLTYTVRPMLADVRIADERDRLPWPRVRNGSSGFSFAVRLNPGLWRLVRLERGEPAASDEVPDSELAERVTELLGPGPFETVWANRFRIHRRSADRFRLGRVLLAGDAAHVHSPAGGQGMNAGIQDAHNLAWKLAASLDGGDAERLLDSYEIERRAVVVENVSRYTDILTRSFVQTPAALRGAAFLAVRTLLRSARFRRIALRRATMIDLDYPASPLLDAREQAAGIRLPNALLTAPDGAEVRLYDLMPPGPVLLVLGAAHGVPDDLPVARVIRIGRGGYLDGGGVLKSVADGARYILVRPDCHIAWARRTPDGLHLGIQQALGRVTLALAADG